MSKRITVELLRKYGACAHQVAKFKGLFPNGVVPISKLAEKHAKDFDWAWCAAALLSTAAYDGKYARAEAAAFAAFDSDMRPAMALSRDKYMLAWKRAHADYVCALARAFVTLWLSQEETYNV